MKKWSVGVGSVAVLAVGWLMAQSAVLWQLPRGDAHNSGFASLPIQPPLATLWSFIPLQPARVNRFSLVHDGQHAFLVTPNSLYALSLADGQINESWKTTELPHVFTTPPVVADGRVYIGTSRGEVLSFDVETGAPGPSIALKQVSINALGAHGGYLFLGTSDGFVHYAPLSNLTELRSARLGYGVTTNFAFADHKDRTVVVVGTTSRLFFLNFSDQPGAPTLRELARPLPPAGGPLTDPVYDPKTDTVYVGAGSSLARYSQWGTPALPVRLKGSVLGAPVVAPDGTVFVATDSGTVYALTPRGLSIRWQKSVLSSVHAPMLCTGEVLWVATFDGLLLALDTRTGDIRWRFRLGDINPNFVGVTVYAPIAATPFGLVVVDTLGRAYAFTDARLVRDTAPPTFYDATLLLLSVERQVVGYRLLDNPVAQEAPAIPGRPPIYLRVRVADRETGVNESSLKAQLVALRAQPTPITDLSGTFKPATGEWTINVHVEKPVEGTPERVVRVLSPLPDGEYVVVVQATDYAGNTVRESFGFRVDNTLPPPQLQTAQSTPGAPGAPGSAPGLAGARRPFGPPGGPGGY